MPIITIAQSSGKELINASIKFHDPQSNWSKTKALLVFSDTRPDKEARAAKLYLNNVD